MRCWRVGKQASETYTLYEEEVAGPHKPTDREFIIDLMNF
jgi:hypothetical protein